MRYDKRGKGSQQLKYLNNICKTCDNEISNKHYFKNKSNPDFHKKWLEKSQEYYHSHKEEIKAKMKLKRQTPEYKKMMREYRQRRKDIIHKQEAVTKKRYHEKHKNNITDRYCITKIKEQTGINDSEITSEMIEVERVKILMSRIGKYITNRPYTGVKKICSCCGVEKDETEFYKKGKKSKDRIAHCKKCSNLKCKTYRQNKKK